MGAYAVLLFTKLGTRVDVILRENFRSVLAGQQMKEAAERMDSGLFFSLVGEEERGRDLYAQNLPVFKEGLKTELGNITLPGEDKLADDLRRSHEEYTARAGVFWQTADLGERRAMYFGEMLPTFTRIKDLAQEIISINQDAMVKADRDARELSARSTRYMIRRKRPWHGCGDFLRRAAAEGDSPADPGAHGRFEGTWGGKTRPGRSCRVAR